MHATQNPVAEQVTTPARTLRDAALYLSRHGWTQGAYYDASSGSFTPPACLVGAVGMVCYGGPVAAPALNYDDPGYPDFVYALDVAEAQIGSTDPEPEHCDAYGFNDASDRTADQVIALLRAAADEWDRTNGGAA